MSKRAKKAAKRKAKLQARKQREIQRKNQKERRLAQHEARIDALKKAWLEAEIGDEPAAVDKFIVCPKPFHGHLHAEPLDDTDGSVTVSRYTTHTKTGHRHALLARVTHGMFEHLVEDHGYSADERSTWIGRWLLSVDRVDGTGFDIWGPFGSREAAADEAISAHECLPFEQAIYTEAHDH